MSEIETCKRRIINEKFSTTAMLISFLQHTMLEILHFCVFDDGCTTLSTRTILPDANEKLAYLHEHLEYIEFHLINDKIYQMPAI